MRSTHDDIQLCPSQTIKVVESEMLIFEMLEKELELEHCHPLLPASLQCDVTATPGRSHCSDAGSKGWWCSPPPRGPLL